MTLKQVAITSNNHDCTEISNGISLELTPRDNTSELEAFTSYFQLLPALNQVRTYFIQDILSDLTIEELDAAVISKIMSKPSNDHLYT